MVTAESVKTKLQNLIAQANAATGGADTDMTAAVTALIAGYGQGGGGGTVLLESGEFTLTADTSIAYTVELTKEPDMFICFPEVPETDTSAAATDGALCINIPQLADLFQYATNNVTNLNWVLNWYTAGTHQPLENYAWVSTDDSGIKATIKPRSNAYKLKGKTYKWETYKLWA